MQSEATSGGCTVSRMPRGGARTARFIPILYVLLYMRTAASGAGISKGPAIAANFAVEHPAERPWPTTCGEMRPRSRNAFVVELTSLDEIVPAYALLESVRLTCTLAHLLVHTPGDLPSSTGQARLSVAGAPHTFRQCCCVDLSTPRARQVLLHLGYTVVRSTLLSTKMDDNATGDYQSSTLDAWTFEEYDSVVLLKPNMIVLHNIDALFLLPHNFSAVTIPLGRPCTTPHKRIRCMTMRAQFSSSLLVIKPSMHTFARLRDAYAKARRRGKNEQAFLNDFFHDWNKLDNAYNLDIMDFNVSRNGPLLTAHNASVVRWTRAMPWLSYQAQQHDLDQDVTTGLRRPESFDAVHAVWRAADESCRLRLRAVLVQHATLSGHLAGTAEVGWAPRSAVLQRQFWFTQCIPGRSDPGCYSVFPFFCGVGDTRCVGLPAGAAGVDLAVQDNDITVLTQLTTTKLLRLAHLAAEWGGPISATLYIAGRNRELEAALALLRSLALPPTVVIHLVTGGSLTQPYPINLLRSISQRFTRTHLIFNLDVDFQPMAHLRDILLHDPQYAHVWKNARLRHAFVLPAFQQNLKFASSSLLKDKRELCVALEAGLADVFHATMPGHRATNPKRWLRASRPYYVEWSFWYEPYIIVNKTFADFPEYNIRFVDRGLNKAVFNEQLVVHGFRYVVLPHAFIVHAWESPKLEENTRRVMFPDRKTVYKAVVDHDRATTIPIITPDLPQYDAYKPEEPWLPASATRERGVQQRTANPRLVVDFNAWINATTSLTVLSA